MSNDVDTYIEQSTNWPDEMRAVRRVMLDAGLDEDLKWAKPCYSHDGANIAIFQEMKNYLSVMFFKGALLSDPHGVLQSQGPNSRSARRFEFSSVEQVEDLADVIADYVQEAIEVEASGQELPPAPDLELVAELQERLAADPELRAGFEGLTPGRQREYNLHIGGAKKSETRHARIDKFAEKIRSGKGMRDR